MPRSAAANRLIRERTREKIVTGSVATFAKKGFHGASMDDVAAAASVSKGLAYSYFRSKDELLACIIKDRLQHLFEVGESLDRTASPAARLQSAFDALLQRIQREPDTFRLYLSLSLEKSLSPVAVKAIRSVQSSLTRYLDSLNEAFRDLGSKDPELDAFIFRSALLGLFLRLVRSVEDVPVAKVRRRLIELFDAKPATRRRRT